MANLNPDIADRLTPSTPIEQTYGAQPVATGKKFTTIFAHKAASGDTVPDYTVYTVVNVGVPAAAQAEVDAIAGTGSEAGIMAKAFVNANAAAGRSNFPAFRVVLLPNAELHFGGSSQALNAVMNLRNDMLVSPYPSEDTTNKATILAFATLISGPDRNLHGQFGSFVQLASLQPLSTQVAFADNSRYLLELAFPDSNTALVTEMATTANMSDLLTGIASTAGIYPGAQVTGTGIPSGTVVEQIFKTSILMSQAATASATVSVAFQNEVSQSSQVLAAASAGAKMSLPFPYVGLNGVTVGGLVPPQIASDTIQIDPNGSSEEALDAGLECMFVQPGGTMGFIRTVTTYTTLPGPGNIRATSYFDWQDLEVLQDFREDCFLIAQNPPFNNNPGSAKATVQLANQLKDEVLREAFDYENDGAFQGVKTLAPQFVVQPSTSSRGRFDFFIPVNVVPNLQVIAGNVQAVAGIGDFTA